MVASGFDYVMFFSPGICVDGKHQILGWVQMFLPIYFLGPHILSLPLQLSSLLNLVLLYHGSLAGISWLVRCHYNYMKLLLELLYSSPQTPDSCPAMLLITMMMVLKMVVMMIGVLEVPATPPVLILSGRIFLH